MATITVEQAFQMATAHHQAGRLLEAEQIYRQILASLPDHADALHALGLIAVAAGHLSAALDLISRAITQSPLVGIYHSNLGETYRLLRQMDNAVASFRRALELHPGLPSAQAGLGTALILARRHAEAVTHYEQMLTAQPESPGMLLHHGVALHGAGRVKEATDSYRRAVALHPGSSEAHNNLGSACFDQGLLDEALANFETALQIEPLNPQAHNNLGNARLHQDRAEEAIASFRRALELLPHYPEAHNNLASALWRLGDAEASLFHSQQALQLAPSLAAANWQLAAIYLSRGRYREGWAQYEWRSRVNEAVERKFTQPRWKGEPVQGQTIFLHPEQGFGDTIQFLRYAPLVRDHAQATRVIMECPTRLLRLVSGSSDWNLDLIHAPLDDEAAAPNYDLQAPLLSLPYLLGIAEPLATSGPYLHADPCLRETWRRRLAPGAPFRVGLAWAGNPEHADDRHRSIPFGLLDPILRIPGTVFYSLQIGPGAILPEDRERCGVIDLTDHFTDFADTAALMAELDLIISVDTAIAHLAGALGRPVWTLLPFVPDWRWGLERKDTPWYPTMRLFRQPARGDWDSVLQRVAEDLAALRG